MKKSLALLIAIILSFGVFVSCASSCSKKNAVDETDKDAAIALYEECKTLKDQVPEAKKSVDGFTRGFAIFSLAENYIEKKLYTEALEPLGQVKKYWTELAK